MSSSKYDLIVIGGGPGGYVAAIRASQLGLRTALVEKEQLGGVCLNWGCIPTKALLRSAEIHQLLKSASAFGLRASDIGVDWSAVIGRSRQVAAQLSKGVAHLLKKNQVDVIYGNARFASANSLLVVGADDILLLRLVRVRESSQVWQLTVNESGIIDKR